jgi:hypothetical protein
MLVTLGHCNTSATNVSVLHLVFEPATIKIEALAAGDSLEENHAANGFGTGWGSDQD